MQDNSRTKPMPTQQFNQLSQQQQFTIENPSQGFVRNYGNNIILTRNENGQPSLVLGPHWYIFAFAFLLTVTLFIMLLFTMKAHLHQFWYYALIVIGIVYAYSYLRVGLSNPGFAQPSSVVPPNAAVCQVCKVVKTRSTYHCSDCNVCIQGFDHHCPWVGKCIGSKNLSSFYFFLIMIFGTLILCFIATIASANPDQQNKKPGLRVVG